MTTSSISRGRARTSLAHPGHRRESSSRSQSSEAPRPFACEWNNSGTERQCPKSFNRKSDLQRHFRIHTNERPYHCNWNMCDKSFIQRSALTVHLRTHTGEKPHKCQVKECGKAFSDSSSLARHRRIHTGNRPYRCSVESCNKSFCRKTTLSKHVRRIHNALPGEEFAGEDVDEELEDEESPSPVTNEAPQNVQYPRAQWTLPVVTPELSYLSQASPMPGQFEERPVKLEALIQATPFAGIPGRPTSDLSYLNYPHPERSQGHIQNLTSAPLRRPGLVMQTRHSNHSSFDSPRSAPRVQTDADMAPSFSAEGMINPSLQASPSSLSDGSTVPDSSISQDYSRNFGFPTTQPQMQYPATPTLDPYSIGCNVSAQAQPAQPFIYSEPPNMAQQYRHDQAQQEMQRQREARYQEAQRQEIHQVASLRREDELRQLQLQQMQLQQQQRHQQEQEQQAQFVHVPQDDTYVYRDPVPVPPSQPMYLSPTGYIDPLYDDKEYMADGHMMPSQRFGDWSTTY